jgi:hypothetical protein
MTCCLLLFRSAPVIRCEARRHTPVKYSAIMPTSADGLAGRNPVQWHQLSFQATTMSRYLLVLLLLASPVAAQVKMTPKTNAAHPDPCAPIGRTADGKLVYSMKCETLPTPPAPSPEAELKEAPAQAAAEPEVRQSGIFGWSYDRR